MAIESTPQPETSGLALFERLRRDPDVIELVTKADSAVAKTLTRDDLAFLFGDPE